MDNIFAIVSSKGQIVIPAAIRSEDNRLILQPINDRFISSLRGCCKGQDSLVEARERDHKRDERAKSRKLAARGR
jgi:bifunctional DNA-binding transcriptional regulator/antitoxin component of YhaV-PrlF toxin-antitoxin module